MAAQAQPLRLQITEGVIEPMPFAVPAFVPEDNGGMEYADALSRVVASNLSGTGLFREVPRESHIARITSFDTSISYPDWRAVNAQALIVGAVSASGDRLTVKFRLFDVVSGQQMGEGLQFAGAARDWRRMGHKVSDAVYSQITGEDGYFDSRVFVRGRIRPAQQPHQATDDHGSGWRESTHPDRWSVLGHSAARLAHR